MKTIEKYPYGGKMERRNFLVGATATVVLSLSASRAGAVGTPSGLKCADIDKCSKSSSIISSRVELEGAFSQLGELSESHVKQIARASQFGPLGGRSRFVDPSVAPIVAIATKTLIGCSLSAAWAFRDGKTNQDNAVGRVAEIIVGCLAIPGLTSGTYWLLKLIWTHRQKIAAALSVMGLTTAQLAPLRNARHP